MREFRVVMENDPSLAPQAIRLSGRCVQISNLSSGGVVPPNVYDSFLGFLISRNETPAAAKVWDKIFSARQPIERPDLFGYMRYLIAHQEVSQATLVWQQAATLSGLAAY
jgi:hypothetical protein